MADIENFDIDEIQDKAQKFYEKYKNIILGVAVGIALIIGGIWWYNSNKAEKTLEANTLLWKQENNFQADNYDEAINGNELNVGYATIANEYRNTDPGQIATYNMGVSYLNKGDFANAIASLENVAFDDIILGSVAKGALGDAYFELGKVDKAISNYKAAISHSDNDFTVPIYLRKLAVAQENADYKSDAIATYKRLQEQYPSSQEALGVDQIIAKLEAK